MKRSTRSIDIRIGKKIRHRRWALTMSQKTLADRLGVSFQQLQKYESGANRISASRLWEAATALDVPLEYFFLDCGTGEQSKELSISNDSKSEMQLAL